VSKKPFLARGSGKAGGKQGRNNNQSEVREKK